MSLSASQYKACANHEKIDWQLDCVDNVTSWRAKRCPIEGCTTFDDAKAWSFINYNQVLCYVKHHLMASKAKNHSLSEEQTTDLVCTVDVEERDWTLQERLVFAASEEVLVRHFGHLEPSALPTPSVRARAISQESSALRSGPCAVCVGRHAKPCRRCWRMVCSTHKSSSIADGKWGHACFETLD